MKKRICKILISCLVFSILCMATLSTAVFAAEDDTTYVVSFRPGESGVFSDDAVSYLSSFGTAQKSAAGNLFVEVKSGSAFPADIISYLDVEDGYYYKDGFAGTAVTGDATYVAQYGVLSGGGIPYAVRYVDAVSGAELAESYNGYANSGDVISFTAKAITGYNVDSESKAITVTQGAELRFLYTADGSLNTIEYEYGENTVIPQTVATPEVSQPTPGGDLEPIDENDVPLASGIENNTESQGEDTETIDDEEVPLAPGNEGNDSADSLNWGIIASAIGGGVALIAILAAVAIRRKKRS